MKKLFIAIFASIAISIALTPFLFSLLIDKSLKNKVETMQKRGLNIKIVDSKLNYLHNDYKLFIEPSNKFLETLNIPQASNLDGLKLDSNISIKNLPASTLSANFRLVKIPKSLKEFLGDEETSELLQDILQDAILLSFNTGNMKTFKGKLNIKAEELEFLHYDIAAINFNYNIYKGLSFDSKKASFTNPFFRLNWQNIYYDGTQKSSANISKAQLSYDFNFELFNQKIVNLKNFKYEHQIADNNISFDYKLKLSANHFDLFEQNMTNVDLKLDLIKLDTKSLNSFEQLLGDLIVQNQEINQSQNTRLNHSFLKIFKNQVEHLVKLKMNSFKNAKINAEAITLDGKLFFNIPAKHFLVENISDHMILDGDLKLKATRIDNLYLDYFNKKDNKLQTHIRIVQGDVFLDDNLLLLDW